MIINSLPQQKFLFISLNKSSYYPDEEIIGEVELNNSGQLVLSEITLSFYILENWIKLSSTPVGESNREHLFIVNLNIRKLLNINTQLLNLSPGKFIFPFKFRLPKLINPCFEYPSLELKGYIRYSLEAQIVSPYVKGGTSTYLIFKSRPKLNNNSSPVYTSSIDVLKWNMFSEGNTTLNVSLLNNINDIKYGTQIKFNIEIDNIKGKLNASESKVVLIRKVEFKDKKAQKVKETLENECKAQIFKTVVNKGEKKSFEFSIDLKDIDKKLFDLKKEKLPYTNITDISYFLPSVVSSVLECSYTLRVTLYFDSFVAYKHRPRVFIPINICHQSAEEYQLEILQLNQINNNNKNYINNNLNNINQINQNSIKEDNENDLPSKEEIEKNKESFNEGDMEGAPSCDAPAPAFAINNNIKDNSDNNNFNVINTNDGN